MCIRDSFIADQLPLSQTDKDENILRLKDLHVSALTIYEKLRKFRPPGQEIRQKIDACDALTASRVTQPTQQLQDVHKSPNVLQGSSSADKTADIVTTIADSFSLSRLPAPEPTTFSGEPIHYPDWKSSFYALIHRKNLPLCDKMYYLKRYVSGSAKQAL